MGTATLTRAEIAAYEALARAARRLREAQRQAEARRKAAEMRQQGDRRGARHGG